MGYINSKGKNIYIYTTNWKLFYCRGNDNFKNRDNFKFPFSRDKSLNSSPSPIDLNFKYIYMYEKLFNALNGAHS